MTRLIALLGVVCVCAFIGLVPISAPLIAGIALLALAATRAANERKGRD